MKTRLAWRTTALPLAGAGAFLLFQGCSGGSGQGGDGVADAAPADAAPACTLVDQSPQCPTPAPSFKDEVQPLIKTYCYECHGPGGIEQSAHDFTSYSKIVAHDARTMAFELGMCLMPLADAGAQPSMAERQVIIDWASICGAPDN